MKFCTKCGAELMDEAVICPKCGCACGGAAYGGASAVNAVPTPGMSFSDAIKSGFTHYVGFSGRARRSEYWLWVLFVELVAFVLAFIGGFIQGFTGGTSIFTVIGYLWAIAVILPNLAIEIRRLHDIGKSGWYLLFVFIPIVGWIFLLIWFCTDSQPSANMYGPSPKYLQ